ncbi:MAG TPA: hypothetical protein VLQ79_00025 [Myxococcaceae bacterium]|nr:hypothetical protein [Myxococcaceae bacterium]
MTGPAHLSNLERDLGYVRGALDRAQPRRPAAIPLLWAALVLVGFSLLDLAPSLAGPFWLVASPLGFLASVWAGRRAAARSGVRDRASARRHLLHWAGLLGALLLLVPLVRSGALAGGAVGQAALLLVAVGYWLDGVHHLPANRWVAVVLAAGYLASFVVQRHVWLLVGGAVAGALVVSSVWGQPGQGDPHDGR